MWLLAEHRSRGRYDTMISQSTRAATRGKSPRLISVPSEELVRPVDCDDGFLALLGYNREFDLPLAPSKPHPQDYVEHAASPVRYLTTA